MTRLLPFCLVLLLSCAAVPAPTVPTPTPQAPPMPLPVVTLTLEPSIARVTLADASTIICLAVPEVPAPWVPAGALHTVCRAGRAWVTLVEVH
jgi:hypothetical protein